MIYIRYLFAIVVLFFVACNSRNNDVQHTTITEKRAPQLKIEKAIHSVDFVKSLWTLGIPSDHLYKALSPSQPKDFDHEPNNNYHADLGNTSFRAVFYYAHKKYQQNIVRAYGLKDQMGFLGFSDSVQAALKIFRKELSEPKNLTYLCDSFELLLPEALQLASDKSLLMIFHTLAMAIEAHNLPTSIYEAYATIYYPRLIDHVRKKISSERRLNHGDMTQFIFDESTSFSDLVNHVKNYTYRDLNTPPNRISLKSTELNEDERAALKVLYDNKIVPSGYHWRNVKWFERRRTEGGDKLVEAYHSCFSKYFIEVKKAAQTRNLSI